MGFGYAVYFTERSKHRVVRWDPDTGDVDIAAGEPADGDPDQTLSQPYGLAFDRGGSLHIADKAHHRICKLSGGRLKSLALSDPQGTRRRRPDSPLGYDPLLQCPTALFMEEDGSFLCSFADDNTIYRVHKDQSLELVLGVPPNRNILFMWHPKPIPPTKISESPLRIPTGVVKRKDGTIFFIERVPQVVRAYHPDTGLRCLFPHELHWEYSQRSQAPDLAFIGRYHPSYPGSLALDSQEVLHMTEVRHACVFRIDVATGEMRKVIQLERSKDRILVGVAGLAFGPDGTAWIMNTVSGSVQGFEPTAEGYWKDMGIRLTQIRGVAIKIPDAGSGLALGR
jgi:hypothetical protein